MFLALFGFIVHIILFASIFDIYFRSPIVHDLPRFQPTTSAPASRLVLIVADGLRADKLFGLEGNVSSAPYIRNILKTRGTWGISHTRVPTESRPGHVAIIAGLYEDVSAVTKGWKENPVNFDSVFNVSRYTWSWGSPDILPIFSKGVKSNNIFIETYSSNEEDFVREDPSHLDKWVLEKFQVFLDLAKSNQSLSKELKENKIIFFLHLLGLDTLGHSLKPTSEKYISGISVVDEIVQKCVNLMDDFFKDDKTAYIFTSDHGMTDWGSHGAGSTHETQTPLVAWGAGIQGPKGAGKDNHHDGLSADWGLSSYRRNDVNQADIAPLMSTLLGLSVPLNSVGVLPLDYLSTEWSHKTESLFLNAQQILAQFKNKMKRKQENSIRFFYRPFKELTRGKENELLDMIDNLIGQRRFMDAAKVIHKMIELALKGLNYYHKYDRFSLCFSVVLSFVGWMSYLVLIIIDNHTSLNHTTLENMVTLPSFGKDWSRIKITLIFLVIGICSVAFLKLQSVPWMHYLYYLLPVLIWMLVFLKCQILAKMQHYLNETESWLKTIFGAVLILFGIELLVLSFFHRILYTFGLLAFSSWPFFTILRTSKRILCLCWLSACLLMSVFPVLPVVGRDSNYNLVTLSGWICIMVVAFCARRNEIGLVRSKRDGGRKEPFRVVVLTTIQVFLLWLATFTVKTSSGSISDKQGLPLWCQIISWMILGGSFILPLYSSSSMLTRLLNISASFLSVSLLMSITHECLFSLGICILMFLWLRLEHQLNNSPQELHEITFSGAWWIYQKKDWCQNMSLEDLRRAFFFIFFIFYAFFGVGNIASINSFEPSSVYCFLTIFNPFIMGFLLLVKVIIPFLLVSVFFRGILISIKVSTNSLFLLVLLFSDFMAMNFFLMVKDSGSWLDIGVSISHYVIMMSTILFVILLYGLAWILTTVQFKLPLPGSKRHAL